MLATSTLSCIPANAHAGIVPAQPGRLSAPVGIEVARVRAFARVAAAAGHTFLHEITATSGLLSHVPMPLMASMMTRKRSRADNADHIC